MKNKKWLASLPLLALFIFFYLPILFMMIFSFNGSKSLTHFTTFSLRWYGAMLKNHAMMESLYITILVAVLATAVSTFVGTMTAIGLSSSPRRLKRFISQLNDFPLMNPDIVTAIGLMLLFITVQIPKGLLTLLLAHIAFCIPYVILSVMPKVRSLDRNLADAAMDLGATPMQAIRQVILPQIMPGVISGALIAFTMSFDDFIISYFVTGGGIKNLSIMVYTMAKRVNPSVNAISTVVVVLITLLLLVINLWPKSKANRDGTLRVRKRWPRMVASGLVAAAVVTSLFFFTKSSNKPFSGQTLRIYMPGEYINEEVVNAFQDETGAKVVMDNFESNEQMYIKVANGEKYDILIPSDYMIERLLNENRLAKIKPEKGLNEAIVEAKFKDYVVPYFWGSVGIVYDKRKVSEQDLAQGYAIFQDTKFKGDIYLYDSERDEFMVALKALGYSMNTKSEKELNEAKDWLVKVVQTMSPEIVTDEIIDNMAQARKAIGLIYSGDAAYIMSENKHMGFYMPDEGTNIWMDGMVVPKDAPNPKLAKAFMHYISQEGPAYDNSDYVGYTSPNLKVAKKLAQSTYRHINAYTPRQGYVKDETFGYDDQTRKIISNLWTDVKIAASNAQ